MPYMYAIGVIRALNVKVIKKQTKKLNYECFS